MIRKTRPLAGSPTRALQSIVHHQAIVPLVLGAVTLVVLTALMGNWGYDDPYITFRYADNSLAGHGFVYNLGERILSTTAPLYAVLLAGLGLVWPNLPTLSNVLSALALVVSAACLWALAKVHERAIVGLIAGLLLTLTPHMLVTFGAETCFLVMLILAALYAYDRSRLYVTAGLLAAAAMVRPDAVIAAVAIGLYHITRYRSVAWRPALLYVGLLGTWYAGLWLYFGSPLPVTLLAKQQQGQMGISTRFGAGFVDLVSGYVRQPLYWPHLVLCLLGFGRVLTRERFWLPLLIWTFLYLLAYTLLGVSQYFWYYAPLMPAFAVLVATGAAVLLRGLFRIRASKWIQVAAAGLFLILLLAPLIAGATWAGWWVDPRFEVYTEIGHWLEANTPPEASVGALEVGIIGYHAHRTMIDFAGLIQPDVARRFTATTSYQESAAWAIQTYTPDYVLLHSEAFASVAKNEWFKAAYRPVHNFADTRRQWLTLYHRSESP